LAACQSPPDQKQALYAVESAYVLVANDEAAAIGAGVVPPDAAAAMRATDTTLYAALVAWRTSVEAGDTAGRAAPARAATGVPGPVSEARRGEGAAAMGARLGRRRPRAHRRSDRRSLTMDATTIVTIGTAAMQGVSAAVKAWPAIQAIVAEGRDPTPAEQAA